MNDEVRTGGVSAAAVDDEGRPSQPSTVAADAPRSSVHRSSFIVHHSAVAAVVLAAGRSRRMGAFKPLLPFGGRTVVGSCVAGLLEAGVGEVVVVVGHRGGEVRAALANLPVGFASNDEAGSEMGASVARGVAALSDEARAALVMPADHPAVWPSVVERLIEARAREGARLVVPEWRGRGGHPLLVSLELREELLNLDARGGLRGLLAARACEVRRVPVECPFIARDVDTWDDYAALHAEVFGVAPPLARPCDESSPA